MMQHNNIIYSHGLCEVLNIRYYYWYGRIFLFWYGHILTYNLSTFTIVICPHLEIGLIKIKEVV